MIDIVGRFGWKKPGEKNASTMKIFFQNIIKSFSRKPNIIEPDDGKNFEKKYLLTS